MGAWPEKGKLKRRRRRRKLMRQPIRRGERDCASSVGGERFKGASEG